MENNIRSLAKTVSWRILATSLTMLLVFLFTGNIVVSAGVGSLELLSKTVAYYIHERLWNLTDFGRDVHVREEK